MRVALSIALITASALVIGRHVPAVAQTRKGIEKAIAKGTVAAESTRTKLLKVKVSGAFTAVRLGDILKEFAAQVEMQADQPVLWSYGIGFPFSKTVSFAAKDQPLESVLDELLAQAGGLGYVVVSKDGDKYDGWVRLTTAGERGTELPPPTAEEETAATERLVLAKKLIDAGKPASAKPLLEILVRKYAATKAGMDAKVLLEKIEK